MSKRIIRVATALAAALVATACSTEPAAQQSGGAASPSSSNADGAAPRVVARNLDAPWSIAFAGTTALISERDTGRILELAPSGSTREIGTVPGVNAGGEGGLLGIAVRDNRLYAYLTAENDNRIVRFDLNGAAGSYALGPSTDVLTGIPSARIHNGGRIAFGPDGMLYATTGDANERGDSQNLASLGGKILRMTADGARPADNPFPDSLVYSYGHRNPQGIAWSADGTLYSSEFGQNTWDELNRIRPGGNYGWPTVEGIAGRDGFIDPLQQWSTDDASPSGMAIAGTTIYIANLRGERLRVIPLADPSTGTDRLVGELGRLRDVVPAPEGGLWVLTSNTDGRGSARDGDDEIVHISAP